MMMMRENLPMKVAIKNSKLCPSMEHYSVNQGLFPVVRGRESHTAYPPGRIFEYSSELKSRAKRWDEKHLDGLRLRKDKLFDEYKEQQKKKRREAELINAR